jgi:hypothetical protein
LVPDSIITANNNLDPRLAANSNYSRNYADMYSLMNGGAWLCNADLTAASGATPSSV